MGWPSRLVLVRHAQSEGNIIPPDERAKSPYATHKLPLTARGRKQAEITGQYLLKEYDRFDIRYVSYYTRARQTMEILCPGEKVYEDPRLAEGQRGIWHTMQREEIERYLPFEIERKDKEDLYHHRPLGGENWADMELRIHSILGTLARDYEGQNVLVVVHGHWQILCQRLIHHFSIEEAIRRYEAGVFKNASVTEYQGTIVDGKSRLNLIKENIAPWEGLI